VDGLTRLPLARRLDDARVVLGPQASFIPRQAADGHQTTNGGLRIAHQLLIIYVDETLRRQERRFPLSRSPAQNAEAGPILQLNVDNIADRRFYDGLDDNHVNVSAGRSVRLSFIVQK
jgi:hypothetical protein